VKEDIFACAIICFFLWWNWNSVGRGGVNWFFIVIFKLIYSRRFLVGQSGIGLSNWKFALEGHALLVIFLLGLLVVVRKIADCRFIIFYGLSILILKAVARGV
jgi:hypothetical protein